MSFSVRYVPATLLTIFSLAVTVCAQSTTRQTTKTPRGSISGWVTIKDKGAVGVAIGLRKDAMNPFEPYTKVVTDHDGFYRIENLAAGAYEVSPSAPAFVIANNNNNQRGKTVIVAEDENVENINFSLVRGGVITGRVTDADGRAVIQQQVSVYRMDPGGQQDQPPRPVFTTNAVVTDDRGVYRMYGLIAGRYKVAAGRAEEGNFGVFAMSRNIYRQVFHPDVSEYAKAHVIEVIEGSEATNVDIALGRAQATFTASGRVIDAEKNAPVPHLRLGVQRAAGRQIEMVPTLATTNAQGDFIIEGLAPGKYGVYLFQMSSQDQVPDMRVEQSSFDIVDQDVSGITVRLTKGATLSGVVVLESDDKTVLQKLQQMQLRAFVMAGPGGMGGFGQSSVSPIGPDGSFRLGGLAPGTVNIFLNAAMGNPMNIKGYVISRIERDGVAMSQRVEVKEGEQISGLRIVIAYGTATLRGVVKFENGSLPPGGQIFARLVKPGDSMAMSTMQPPQVDARGHFMLEGLAAGMYELHVSVTAGVGVTARGWPRTTKQPVNVQDGIVNEVVVTIDLGATPK